MQKKKKNCATINTQISIEMGHISTVHYEECKVSLTAWKFKKCAKDTVDHTWHWRLNKKENILYFDYNIRTKSYMKQHIFNTINPPQPHDTSKREISF